MGECLKEYSSRIWKSGNQFDIDILGNNRQSKFDLMIQDGLLKKGLENDSLYYVEGAKFKEGQDSFKAAELDQELEDAAENDVVSNGDHEEDLDEKIHLKLEKEAKHRNGVFERFDYLTRVFPSLKIQKPGRDYYGTSTLVLAIIAIFVIAAFNNLTVSQADLLPGAKESNNIFKGDMSICLLLMILLIILERYINRTDTKAVEDTQQERRANHSSVFGTQKYFERSSTERSMTVKLKTLKTSDIDY